MNVSADILADANDVMEPVVQFKYEKDKKFSEVRKYKQTNDIYDATFQVEKKDYYTYFVVVRIDYALNWKILKLVKKFKTTNT